MSTTVTGSPAVGLVSPVSASIGKKVLVAVSGSVAFLYVVGHMIGNLQIYLGQNQINVYAETLHSMGPLLWVVRAFLLLFFGLHIWVATQLKLQNYSARPDRYHRQTPQKSTYASRTMIWTGLTILAFVVYHIMHFTTHSLNPEFSHLTDSLGRHDTYTMIVSGFQSVPVVIFYLIAVGLLSFHLSHGVASMFQSIGLNTPKWQARLDRLAWLASVVLFCGYASIPISIWTGFVSLSTKGGVL